MFQHSATVETFTGSGPNGDTYAAPVAKRGFLDDGVQLVATERGSQLVQASKWYTSLTDADLYTPGTRIAVNGRTVVVDKVRRRSGGGLNLPDHLECDL